MNKKQTFKLWFFILVTPSVWAWAYTNYSTPFLYLRSQPSIVNRDLGTLSPKLWPSWSSSNLMEAYKNLGSKLSSNNGIIVIGDTRASASGLGPSARWPSLVNAFNKHHSSVLLHLGDWVQDGRNLQQWKQSLTSLQQLKQMSLITVRGNHDRGGWFENLGFSDVPQAPLRITMVGSMLFFLLDSEVTTEIAQEHISQLFAQGEIKPHLKALLGKSEARIWVQHRPIWSSGNHGSDERNWRHWLVPKLEALGIDLMLAGHDHDYERFCPSIGVDELRRCKADGITYIVSGGGATVTVPLPNLSWKQSSSHKRHNNSQRILFSDRAHYLHLKVLNKVLIVEAWASDFIGHRQLFDRVKRPLKNALFTR